MPTSSSTPNDPTATAATSASADTRSGPTRRAAVPSRAWPATSTAASTARATISRLRAEARQRISPLWCATATQSKYSATHQITQSKPHHKSKHQTPIPSNPNQTSSAGARWRRLQPHLPRRRRRRFARFHAAARRLAPRMPPSRRHPHPPAWHAWMPSPAHPRRSRGAADGGGGRGAAAA